MSILFQASSLIERSQQHPLDAAMRPRRSFCGWTIRRLAGSLQIPPGRRIGDLNANRADHPGPERKRPHFR